MNADADKKEYAHIIRWITIALAGLSVIAALLAFVKMDAGQVMAQLRGSISDHWPGLVFSVLLLWGSLLLRALRWPKIHGEAGRRGEQIGGYLWAFNIGVFAPFRLGDAYFISWFAAKGFSGVKATLGLASERVVDLFCLVLIVFFVSLQLPGLFKLGDIAYPTYLVWLHVLIAIGLALYFWVIPKAIKARIDQEVIEIFARFRASPSIFVYTVFIWLFRGLSIWVILPLFGVAPDLAIAFAILAGVNFAAAMMPTPAAIGSFEAAMAAILVAQGLSLETALLCAVFYHFIVYGAGLVLALVGRLILLYRSAISVPGE